MFTRFAILLTLCTLLAACGSAAAPAATAPTADPMAGMDHSAHGGGGGELFDAEFIDGMIAHHEGAIAMANQALAESERAEIRTLAEAIIAAQQAEITQLRAWRTEWYPDLPETPGMKMDMGPMTISEDASVPFDQRFIDAMIPHHEGAIAMAQSAQQSSQRPEITALAAEVISAQQAEIAQMQAWRSAWFGR